MSLETFVNADASNLTTARCQSATDLGSIPFKAQAAGDQVVIDLFLTGLTGLLDLQAYGSVRLGLGALNARPESGTYIPETGEDPLQWNHSALDLQTSVAIWANANAVIEITPFVFKVTFDAVGAQALPTVDADLLEPASSVVVSRLVDGDGSTKEEWIWRIFRNPISLITDWIDLGDKGLQGVLSLGTTGVYDLLGTNNSATTLIELELTDSNGNISTVMQQAYVIAGEVVGNGSTGVAVFESYATSSDLAAKQAQSDTLDAIAALTPTDGNFQVGNGTTWVAESGNTAQKSLGVMSASNGGQIGSSATTSLGGSVGASSTSTNGGAVGALASTSVGGAVGASSSSTSGFAGGSAAVATQDQGVQLSAGTNSTASTIQFLSSGSVTQDQFSVLRALQVFPIFKVSDFPDPLVDGTQYNIYGEVDTAAVPLNLPAAGTRVTICGIGPSAALISSENNYTMFNDGTNSGTIKFENIKLSVTGTDSKVGGLTNNGTGSFVLDRVSLSGCTLAFSINGYNFLQIKDSQDTGCTNVFEFDGVFNIFDVKTYGSFDLISGGTVFSAEASFSVSSRVVFSPSCNITSGATFCDFTASNIVQDAGLEVFLSQFDGAGTFFSNINEKNVKCRWRDNNWSATATENNTYIGGRWVLTSATATAISSTGVYVKVAGTTTYGDEQWFSHITDNAIIYDSTRKSKVIIAGSINISAVSGGADKDLLITIRQWDDSASAYVDLPGTPRATATSAGAIRNISILNEADLDVNDRIELWIQNDTDTVDLTLELGSTLTVTERAN